MTTLEGLGSRIRTRREQQGLKQADIAGALQVSAQAVSKWERGENAPDIALLGNLAKLLNVSTDWILGVYDQRADVFEATLFVSSVNGYAVKAQTTSPRELAIWANGLFYHLTEAALRFDGVVIKQVGDGVLAFFAGPRHQRRAVDAALLARRTTEERVAVALCSGEIYLGVIGHPDYERPDILGDAVNRAFGLVPMAASLSDAGGIIATESTVTELNHVITRRLKPARLKFMPDPIGIFEITSHKETKK